MGIQLDWEIESRQAGKSKGEDEDIKRTRRRRLIRFFLFVGILVGIASGIVYAVVNQLSAAEQQLGDLLVETVEAEVGALRIGDNATFMALQRSATNEWYLVQEQTFEDYQELKSTEDIQLIGRVLDTEIDGQRGRVLVEEIINGVPYTRVWFYWRYSDGWRHLPPDYTFWGETNTHLGQHVNVRYQAVDEPFADALSTQLDSWIAWACPALGCTDLPKINVDVLATTEDLLRWSENNTWQLLIQSPFVEGARTDLPFESEIQLDVANVLAERLVNITSNGLAPTYPTDAVYLRSAIVSWLVGRFVQMDMNSSLIDSFARTYSDAKVGELLRTLTPQSDMNVIANTIGQPVEQTNLDWTDFLTWRLQVEDELIAQRDEVNWLNLYDTRDEQVRTTAYARFNANMFPEPTEVTSVMMQSAPDGTPQLRATVIVGQEGIFREEIVLFNLVNGVWKRAS